MDRFDCNIVGATYLFIIYHSSRSAIDYLLYYTQQIKTTNSDKFQEAYIIKYRLACKVKYNLRKEKINSDGHHQFHQYQQNKQSPLTLTH